MKKHKKKNKKMKNNIQFKFILEMLKCLYSSLREDLQLLHLRLNYTITKTFGWLQIIIPIIIIIAFSKYYATYNVVYATPPLIFQDLKNDTIYYFKPEFNNSNEIIKVLKPNGKYELVGPYSIYHKEFCIIRDKLLPPNSCGFYNLDESLKQNPNYALAFQGIAGVRPIVSTLPPDKGLYPITEEILNTYVARKAKLASIFSLPTHPTPLPTPIGPLEAEKIGNKLLEKVLCAMDDKNYSIPELKKLIANTISADIQKSTWIVSTRGELVNDSSNFQKINNLILWNAQKYNTGLTVTSQILPTDSMEVIAQKMMGRTLAALYAVIVCVNIANVSKVNPSRLLDGEVFDNCVNLCYQPL